MQRSRKHFSCLLINIIMKYFVSKCSKTIYLETGEPIIANVPYELEDEKILRLIDPEGTLRIIDLDKSELITSVKCLNNQYYFFNYNTSKSFCTSFRAFNKSVSINLFSNLVVTIDGVIVLDMRIDNVEYSHFETWNNYCIIYFTGARDFVVIIKDGKCIGAVYVDEYNESKEDRYYLMKMNDGLNHGRVIHLGKTYEDYLVYLDDNDLRLKSEFVCHIFLDCIMAGNYKYANNLLSDDIRQENSKSLLEFFPLFDSFYSVDSTHFILLKKNTLAGIYEFDVSSSSISNIISIS